MKEVEYLELLFKKEIERIIKLISSNKDKVIVERNFVNGWGQTYIFDLFGKEIILFISNKTETMDSCISINGVHIPMDYYYQLKDILMDVYKYDNLYKQIRNLQEVE